MQWVKQVKELVDEGIYIKNLELIAAAASRGLESGRLVLPAFVIQEIANSVLDMWEGRVVRLSEHRVVEDGLRPAFDALADAMLRDAPEAEITKSAEALIITWQSVQSELRELAALRQE